MTDSPHSPAGETLTTILNHDINEAVSRGLLFHELFCALGGAWESALLSLPPEQRQAAWDDFKRITNERCNVA